MYLSYIPRKLKLTLLIIFLMLVFSVIYGCSNEVQKTLSSSTLIYDKEKIDAIRFQDTRTSREINDANKAKKLVSLLQNIEVVKLSLEEQKQLFQNDKVLSNENSYLISLITLSEEQEEDLKWLKGLIAVLKDDRLIFYDTRTMKGSQITQAFITKEKHPAKFAEILEITKSETPIRDLVELNLKIIVSAQQSKASSNSYDFIQEKKKEYDEIVSLGQPALEYMLNRFETSAENGLEEYIMAEACSEILGQKEKDNDWSSGREWYETYIRSKTRPSIKKLIDELSNVDNVEINWQKKNSAEVILGKPEKFEPDFPKEFKADRFKMTFGGLNRTVVLETEASVRHEQQVIPGNTVVDGYILVLDPGQEDIKWGKPQGKKLTKAEEDYFIQMIYGKFSKQRTPLETEKFNKIKDYALAIYFNGKPGMEDYHRNQKELLAQPK